MKVISYPWRIVAASRTVDRLVAIGLVFVMAVASPGRHASAASLLDHLWRNVTGGDAKPEVAEPAALPPIRTVAPPPAADLATPSRDAPLVLAQQAPAQPPPTVPVIQPKNQAVSDTLVITGNAAAVNQVKLLARVVGFLEQIHFDDGAFVKKNDLLFTVQQDQYKAQLQQAQAQLQLQQSALVYAKTEVVRYTALLKRDAASQVDVDHWNFERQSAEANILAAQAQIAIAQLNLSYTEVRAPFDGQMGRHLVDTGNVVGGNGQEAALAEITQLDPIYVVANISTQQALQIRANLDQRRLTLAELHQVPVEVGLQGETGFPHRGTVQYVAPMIDPATGTLYVRGILSNPNRTLLPGVFVNMRLPMGKVTQSALLVPDRVLQEDQGGRYALVVDQNNVVQRRYVQTGQAVGPLRVITSGLNPDDRVVSGELWQASPGTKVVPRLTTLSE